MHIDDNEIIDYNNTFFQGVVEARNDPLKLGRVKVRIIGLHTDNIDLLSSDDLPWALILIPATDSASGGQGLSISGIPPGTHVFGMFLDGINKQLPLILGSIKGIPTRCEESSDAAFKKGETSTSKSDVYPQEKEELDLGVDFRKGFFDPHEEMLSGNPRPNRTNQPDTHPLLRNSSDGTQDNVNEKNIETEKPKNALVGLRTGRDRFAKMPDVIWKEPESDKNTTYPHNRIYESQAGIGSEIDDSPWSERVQQFFNPGTNYWVWSTHNGYEVKRVWGSSTVVKHSPEDKTYVWGNTTDTRMGNTMNICGKTKTTETYDTKTDTIYASNKIRLLGQHNEWVGSNYIINANNDIRISANNAMSLDVGGKYQQSFHDVHHSVYWMRQYIWNEGQVHHIRKRDYYEKTNENHYSIVWDDKRDVIIKGAKHTTIADSYYLEIGTVKGDHHVNIPTGNCYNKIEKEYHRESTENTLLKCKEQHTTIDSNDYKIVNESHHKTIKQDSIEKISGEQTIVIEKDNKLLCKKTDYHVVEESQNNIIEKDKTIQIGDSLKTRIKNNNILRIGKDFLTQFKMGVTKAEQWLLSVSIKTKLITESLEIISKASRHLMSSGAIHSQNDLSIKVDQNGAVVVDGDLGIHIKGRLRIRADGGIVITSNKELNIGSKQELIVGSSTKFRSIAPELTHEKGSYNPVNISVTAEDLSGLDTTIPTIPDVTVDVPQFNEPTSPQLPQAPQKPKLPPLPQIGDFVNNREEWMNDDKLSQTTDE